MSNDCYQMSLAGGGSWSRLLDNQGLFVVVAAVVVGGGVGGGVVVVAAVVVLAFVV